MAHLTQFIDPRWLLETFSYWGIAVIVFAECGLLVGFFLPGDSLLIVAGVFAGAGYLNLSIVLPTVIVAAILGNQTGYWLGKRFGRKIFNKPESFLFHERNVKRSEEFFAKKGAQAVVLSRFIPIIRTFTPIVAGIGNMKASLFLWYNILGTILWGIGVTLAGYWLGASIPNIDHYIIVIVGVIIVLSIVPAFLHLRKTVQ